MNGIKKYADRKNIPSIRIVSANKMYAVLKRIQKILLERGKKKYGRNFRISLLSTTLAVADRIEELLNGGEF